MAKEPKKKGFSEVDLANRVGKMAQEAVGVSATNIANKQQEALERYKRAPLSGDGQIKGRSKFVSGEITSHVDWLTGVTVKVFDTQREPVSFVAMTAAQHDVKLAAQMTKVVNVVMRQLNKHTALLHEWIKNGFITGVGIATVRFEVCEEETLPRLIKGVSEQALGAIYEKEKAGEIVVEKVGEPYSAPAPELPPGALAEPSAVELPPLRDMKIRFKTKKPELFIENLPPEDFIVSKDARIDQKTGGISAKLQGHKRVISRADLIAMGFDADRVKKIVSASDDNSGIANERSETTDYQQGVGQVTDDVLVYEVYTKMVIDGDKPRHYRITLAGDLGDGPVYLDHQEVTKFYPYAPFVPYPIPNTLFGQSIVDRIGQEHKYITQMSRSMLDNLAAHSNPIKIVNPEVTNIDDVLNLYPGATVRSTDPEGGITYNQQQFTGGNALSVLENISGKLDFNTGVGPSVIGIDAADLQNSTATAATQRNNSTQTLSELICRVFAETGYSYLVKLVVDVLSTNSEDAEAYIQRLTDAYEPIVLDAWDADMDVVANVAFGVMNKDANLASLGSILGQQTQFQALGLAGPAQIHTTLTKMAEIAGFPNAGDFFLDPAAQPPKPPQAPPPDPVMIQAQVAQQQIALEAKNADRKHELDLLKLKVEDDRARDQMAQDKYIKEAEISGKYGAQVQIAKINAEQAAARSDVETQMQAMDHLANMAQPQQPTPPQGA